MTRSLFIVLSAFVLALAGCATTKTAQEPAAGKPARKVTATSMPDAPPPKARVLQMSGRIAGANEKLRFVIVDFTNSRRPELHEKLSVYRVGQKVAEIKISGPYRNTTVAADVVAGEVRYGDEVRND